MGMGKYLGANAHCVSIQGDKAHWAASLIQLKGDNQAALALVKDAHVYEWSKHIDVVYHNICDLHKWNQIHVDFMPN